MADVTEFQLTVDAKLLSILRMGLAALPMVAQEADARLTAAINQAVEAANTHVDPPPPLEPVIEKPAKLNGKHSSAV